MSNQKFLIKGGNPLKGTVKMSGYKNSAGPILAASLLTEEISIIDNLPRCHDVLNLIKILEQIGTKIEWISPHKIKINPKDIDPSKIPHDTFQKMRISVLLVGPLLARFKKFKIPHPGGDKIGIRPITTHLKALESFGVSIKEKDGFYIFSAPKNLEGQHIVLDEFSVTATENIMMLASKAKGETKIEIAAAEPQIQDLGNMLKKMGAEVQGLGTHTIKIKGKKKLSGTKFSICYDPTEAGTFLIAFATTQGQGTIENVNPEHLSLFLKKMKEIGVNFEVKKDKILVNKSNNLKPTKIQVLPYPGFPTDLQPQVSLLLTQIKGKSLVHDPLYENRFNHMHELRKMGADIEITDPHRALIFGKNNLKANRITAPDIRGGVSLILGQLIAEGASSISNVYQVDRGHEDFDKKLRALGANIKRVDDN